MNCCDAWRGTDASWCGACGANLRAGRRAWWRVHTDALVAAAALCASAVTLSVAPRHVVAVAEPVVDGRPATRAVGVAPPPPTPTPTRTLDLAREDPPRCALQGGVATVGHAARVDSLTMMSSAGRASLSWVVAAGRRHGSEDSAALELDAQGGVLSVLRAEVPSTDGSERRSVLRAVAMPWRDREPTAVRDERVEVEGRESLRCGMLEGTLAEPDPSGRGTVSTGGGLFACRTIVTDEPFVFGLHSELSPTGEPAPMVTAVAARWADREATPTGWTLALHTHTAHHGHRRRPVATQHMLFDRYDIEGATGVDVPGAGTLVVFRYHGGLQVGWLDAGLRARGPLQRVETLGGEVGLPRVAVRGDTALVVFADRGPTPDAVPGAPRPDPPPYRLFALRATSSGLDAPVALATRADVQLDEFAPTAAALPDGSWVVTWSEGPRHARPGEEAWRHVLLRRYRGDLSPDGGPLEVLPDHTVSDARVVTLGDRALVSMAEGHGHARRVVVRALTCP